jgi:hypothetical protein
MWGNNDGGGAQDDLLTLRLENARLQPVPGDAGLPLVRRGNL